MVTLSRFVVLLSMFEGLESTVARDSNTPTSHGWLFYQLPSWLLQHFC